MKAILSALLLVFFLSGCETLSNIPGYSSPVSETEAQQGIQQALSQGLSAAILQLNKDNGFFGNSMYKIFLPPEAEKIESTLRRVGLGKEVDKAILQINRAAEDAVGFAKPIFADAIRQMSITDAIGIVKGQQDAATTYFKSKTSAQLVQAFKPSIQQSLDKLNATRYYTDIVNLYNKLPTTGTKLNPDLTNYVVGKAVDALFDQVAKEEANIRANPLARSTEILKKVFGSRL